MCLNLTLGITTQVRDRRCCSDTAEAEQMLAFHYQSLGVLSSYVLSQEQTAAVFNMSNQSFSRIDSLGFDGSLVFQLSMYIPIIKKLLHILGISVVFL